MPKPPRRRWPSGWWILSALIGGALTWAAIFWIGSLLAGPGSAATFTPPSGAWCSPWLQDAEGSWFCESGAEACWDCEPMAGGKTPSAAAHLLPRDPMAEKPPAPPVTAAIRPCPYPWMERLLAPELCRPPLSPAPAPERSAAVPLPAPAALLAAAILLLGSALRRRRPA